MSRLSPLLNLSFVILFTSLLSATSLASPLTDRTHEYTLANGMKVVVREDHRAPVVVSQVWYRVGGSYEPVGLTGVSHVLEHMMFKQTKRLEVGEFSRIINRFGGQQNAFTAKDYTGYYQVLAADRLELSIEMEAERMHNLVLTDEEFEKEIQVVMEERRLRTEDKPSSKVYERFLSTAYSASSYSQPVVGWMADLENMTAQDARNWHDMWYAPNNAILVVVGDVKPDDVLQLAKNYFEPIPSRSIPDVKPLTEIANIGQRRLEIELPAQLPSLFMGFNVPVINTAEHEWEPYALYMLAGVLDGGYSARIETEVIREQEIAVSASAGYDATSRGDNLFLLTGIPNLQKNKTLADVEQALLQQIEKLQNELADQQELQRVRAQIVSSIVYAQDSISSQANEIGQLEAVGLSWRLADKDVEMLNAITPEHIQQMAQKYLIKERMTVALMHPIKQDTNQ